MLTPGINQITNPTPAKLISTLAKPKVKKLKGIAKNLRTGKIVQFNKVNNKINRKAAVKLRTSKSAKIRSNSRITKELTTK